MKINSYPIILFVHNKYSKTGGEDSVVANEIQVLKDHGYTVFYEAFSNDDFYSKNPIKKWIAGSFFFFNFSAFFSIYFRLKKTGATVLHVHNFYYTLSPSVFWAGKMAGVKTVATLHNYRLFCLNALLYRNGITCTDCISNRSFKPGIQHACFKGSRTFSTMLAWSTIFHRKLGTWTSKVDHFLVLNPLMQHFLQGIGVAEKKITVKSNFTRATLPNPTNEISDFYLYVGRLEEEKGIRHVIEGFKHSGKKLIIAGDGLLVPYVKENISGNITYVGHKNKDEVVALYQQCKGLIFSSLWIEGMPMTLIEAFSAGVVCIVAASPNTERMVNHHVDGFLYEAGNITSLNNAIITFENLSAENVLEIKKKIKNKYESHYSEAAHVELVQKIYTTVI